MAYPRLRVGVPVVTLVGDASKRRDDLVPPSPLVERSLDGAGDEGTPSAFPDSAIQFCDERIVQNYVHTHVCRLAH